jgi:hypothetical protein
MQLLAHATSCEFAMGIVSFLAGICCGCCLAQSVYSRIKRHRG